jgi:hypothetical protein
MDLHVGFAGYFARPLCTDPARAAQVAALLVDRRWPWPPWWASFRPEGRYNERSRARKVVGGKGRDHLVAGIIDCAHRKLELSRSSQQADNHAHVQLKTGCKPVPSDAECPYDLEGQTRGHELPDGADLMAWLELVHELMVACDVGHAVVPVWPTASACLADVSFMRIVVDTRWGVFDKGPPPDFEQQNSRANFWRIELGGTYVRHPRWGTYLGRSHLERIGGLDAIRAAVDGIHVRELGDLVFLQLTERPEGALTAEGAHRRQQLEAVMEPIVAPARPQEGGPARVPR